MSQLVQTAIGLIPLDLMEVRDTIEVLDNCRKITTTYRYNGEIVKQDVAGSIFRMPNCDSVEGRLS